MQLEIEAGGGGGSDGSSGSVDCSSATARRIRASSMHQCTLYLAQSGACLDARQGSPADGVPECGGTSTLSTTMNLITVMVGSGVLGFPALFAKTGLAFGLMLLVGSCVTSIYLCISLAGAIAAVQGRTARRIDKLDDLGLACFGWRAQQAARVCVNGIMMSKVAVYMVLVGQNLNYIAGFLSYRVSVLLASVGVLGSAFLRDLSVIERVAVIGVVCSMLYFIAILFGALRASSTREDELRFFPGEPARMFSALNVMVFSFGPCDVITTARREMQAPEALPSSLLHSHAVAGILYAGAGAIGYWGFGPRVQGNIGMSMYSCELPECPGMTHDPGRKWLWGYVLAGAVIANLAVTMPIILYCLFTSVETTYPVHTPMPARANKAMRVGTVAVCTLVGLTVPFFLQVVQIMSAALIVPLCFFLPLTFSRKAAEDVGEPLPRWRRRLDNGLLALGACCTIIGLVDSIQDLHLAMREQAQAASAAAAAAGTLARPSLT